jgi:Tol biopolymer transport system component
MEEYAYTFAYGKAIVVQGYTEPFVEITLMRGDGTVLKKLTNDLSRDDNPAWSPDGSMIAFHYLNNNQIFVMNADGSKQHLLAKVKGGANFPAWSRDGKQIAYNSWPDTLYAGCDNVDIFIVNSDGSDIRQVTNGPECDFFPSFTPNGKILFIQYNTNAIRYAAGDVFEINPDGTGMVKITDTSGQLAGYALSPDGSLLAVHNKIEKRIDLLSVDDSQPDRTLHDDFAYDWAQLAWSPDGKSLAVARAGFAHVYAFPVHIIKIDGSGITKIPNVEAFSISWRP